ncbi:MAG TPA: hypothetical protein VGD31_13045, partial [Sphingobacteriaceae bacterium]
MERQHHHGHNHQQMTHAEKQVPVSHQVHDEHMGHHTEDFLKRFWICLFLTIPVLILSEMIQHWFGYHLTFPG